MNILSLTIFSHEGLLAVYRLYIYLYCISTTTIKNYCLFTITDGNIWNVTFCLWAGATISRVTTSCCFIHLQMYQLLYSQEKWAKYKCIFYRTKVGQEEKIVKTVKFKKYGICLFAVFLLCSLAKIKTQKYILIFNMQSLFPQLKLKIWPLDFPLKLGSIKSTVQLDS